jgi:hypothetical protein
VDTQGLTSALSYQWQVAVGATGLRWHLRVLACHLRVTLGERWGKGRARDVAPLIRNESIACSLLLHGVLLY